MVLYEIMRIGQKEVNEIDLSALKEGNTTQLAQKLATFPYQKIWDSVAPHICKNNFNQLLECFLLIHVNSDRSRKRSVGGHPPDPRFAVSCLSFFFNIEAHGSKIITLFILSSRFDEGFSWAGHYAVSRTRPSRPRSS